MSPIGDFIVRLLPNNQDDPERRYFKTVIFISIGMIAIMVVVSLITFLVTFQGKEQTMVPNIEGMALENAMIELQEKALNATIQLHYTASQAEKGLIIGQLPNPGTMVKADSKVMLKVSKGAIVERLNDYVGWSIVDLEAHLRSLVTVYGPLLQIKKPVMRVFDDAPAGTILQQRPEPGTKLTILTDLNLIISRGPQGQTIAVGDYMEMEFAEALRKVIAGGNNFVFSRRKARSGETPGTVVAQSPAAESEVPMETQIQLVIAEPAEIEEGYVFGIMERTFPDFAVPAELTIESISPLGERSRLYQLRHPGGLLTIPYLQQENTTLVVLVEGEELLRFVVRKARTTED